MESELLENLDENDKYVLMISTQHQSGGYNGLTQGVQ